MLQVSLFVAALLLGPSPLFAHSAPVEPPIEPPPPVLQHPPQNTTEVNRVRLHLRKVVQICGGPIEAPKAFKNKGLDFSTHDIQFVLQPTPPLKQLQHMYPRIKQILNRPWPLSPQSLKVKNVYTNRTTFLNVHTMGKKYRSPFLELLRQHLVVLIRRYDNLKQFSRQHKVNDREVIDFLSPTFIPDTNLLIKIFQIFHNENYTLLRKGQERIANGTKTLAAFSSRQLQIPIAPGHNTPSDTPPNNNSWAGSPSANRTSAKDEPTGHSPQYISISLGDLPHLQDNLHHMARHLKHLIEQFKGSKNFSLIMAHNYKFNNEKIAPPIFKKRIERLVREYRHPPIKIQPRHHMIYFLFDLIEQAEQHLENKLSLQPPTTEWQDDTLVLQLPESGLRFSSDNLEHVKAHISDLTNYYRHLVFDVYKGGPRMAQLLKINVDTLHRHIDPRQTGKLNSSSLKMMLKNIIRAQEMAPHQDRLEKKYQDSLDTPAPTQTLQIPTPDGVVELNVTDMSHLSKHLSNVCTHLRQIIQKFGSLGRMTRFMRHMHQSSITEAEVNRFLYTSSSIKSPFVYERIFDLIKKAQPYLKQDTRELNQRIDQLKKHNTALTASFVFQGQKYNLNVEQGKKNINIIHHYIKQQVDRLTGGDVRLLPRKVQVSEAFLSRSLSDQWLTRYPVKKSTTIQTLFYVIQEVQKIKNPHKKSNLVAPDVLASFDPKHPKNRTPKAAKKTTPEGAVQNAVNNTNEEAANDTSQKALKNNKVDVDLWPPLHQAVRWGNLEHLQQSLEEHITQLNTPAPETDETALHWAAFAGDIKSAELLLQAGASTEAVQDLWPIQEAVRASHLPMVKLFIKYGASLDIISHGSNLFDLALARHYFLSRKLAAGHQQYQSELQQATEMLEFLTRQGLKPYAAQHLVSASLPKMIHTTKAHNNVDPLNAITHSKPTEMTLPSTALSQSENTPALQHALNDFKKFHDTHNIVDDYATVNEVKVFHQLNQALAQDPKYKKPNCFELLDDGVE